MDCDNSHNKENLTANERQNIDYSELDMKLISDQDMFEVCQLHATGLMLLDKTNLQPAKADNLYVKKSTQLDVLTPMLMRHEVLSTIVTTVGDKLDFTLENVLVKEQLLLSQELQKLTDLENDEYYDIYHDPVPGKVVTLRPPLLDLIKHVNTLLKDFPEDPNLTTVSLLCPNIIYLILRLFNFFDLIKCYKTCLQTLNIFNCLLV